MSSDRLAQIEFFVQVAELGSLTKAAERLDMSNAAASRTLLALEERLGARLGDRPRPPPDLAGARRAAGRATGRAHPPPAVADGGGPDLLPPLLGHVVRDRRGRGRSQRSDLATDRDPACDQLGVVCDVAHCTGPCRIA